ncbi:choice-of-anchor L domain-containing protein [Taibaiella chishuiensis]|uniref:Gliding motility-associated-like protein n=1 Tax=Taibaiella chishuiensis TaxID=1434707 RepID=A0A2P8DAA0_9BACT|nr:choice-of-anchor L domain-containing protein [Taibaiella chishuiensis]PSK94135.1 gliding motility-associated-like protein [Taibaiella chishuiensis]
MTHRYTVSVLSFFLLFFCSYAANAQISGTVFNDLNGLVDNTVNGTGSNAGGLNAVLINTTTGNVTATTAVAANGTYSFPAPASATYQVLITTAPVTIGSAAPAVTLPANWVNTGEFVGTGAGNDGTVNGILPIGAVTAATNANFGIEQLPNTNVSTAAPVSNPGGTTVALISTVGMGGSDPDGGVIDSIRIMSFPTNTTTLVLGANSYTAGTFPAGGVTINTTVTGQPVPALSIDPTDGAVSVVITYAAIDNAHQIDPTPGSFTIPFTNSVTGIVTNDVNGLLGTPANTIDGPGTNAGGLNAVVVNTVSGNVAAFAAVGATGTYTVTGLPNGTFNILITTATATVGSVPPAIALPANWVSTGEFLGTGAGSDGNVNSTLVLGTIADNVINARLGIEQLPNTNTTTAAPQANPPGTTNATIAAAGFGGTDPDGGVIDSIRILSFPTNTTSITINAVNYTAGTFPAAGVSIPTNATGQPTWPILLDPVTGTVNVVITYTVVDNAGKPDPTPGSLTLPFQESGMTVIDNRTAAQLVEKLTGAGVVVLNPTMTCPGISNGTFNIIGVSNLGLDSGIVLTSGRAMTTPVNQGVNGPNIGAGPAAFTSGLSVDANLSTLVNQSLNDLCRLEFDFVPAGDSVKFEYVFGSSEYQGFSCSQFNDVFGFFISGPGIVGTYNMAVIPGTNIAICVNSTTNPTVNPPNNITACTGMGAGSPFSMYYVNNAGGGTVTYRGFTTVFTASSKVSACDTFHLKLAIADCSDGNLDSGVFLKAGSLSSAALYVKTFGGGGLETPYTNTVRGCPPGVVRVSRSGNLGAPITIPLTYTGTAVNGLDYSPLPSSVTIPAGDSAVNLYVNGIVMVPPVGPKSVVVSVLSPYNCSSTNEPIVLASDTIMILDSIYVKILNPDTAICRGRFVDLKVEADTILKFSWTPASSVSNPLAKDVRVTPTGPTHYTVSVLLPIGTGCPPSTDHVFIDVKDTPKVNLGPDKVTCGDAVQLNAATTPLNPDETFLWTPATALSSATIRNPISTPTGDMIYSVTVNPGAVGCDGHDTIKIRLLPDHITVLNADTVVCDGALIQLRVEGDTAFHYNWNPEQDIADPLVPNSVLTAHTTGWYTLTASYPGCVSMPDSFHVEVQPNPIVNIGPDRTICTYDTINLYAAVTPAYNNYSYLWQPGTAVSDSTINMPIFSQDESVMPLWVIVKTPNGCTGGDTMRITVHPGDFMLVSPLDTGVCPPALVQLKATGAQRYLWSPSYGLDDVTSATPIATPLSSTDYTVIGTSNFNCYDTQVVSFKVYPAAAINLPDSVQIWPGERYQIDPGGNCLYFEWFPSSGLSAINISNPLASPEVRTRYFVTARTEYGCELKDSVDVLVNTESLLDLPNAFVPTDGDLKIVKRGLANLKYFRIFNRWGNMVFETSNIDQGWDGRYKGQEQPLGVYIYSVDAETSTGKKFRKDGNVTLLR